MKKKERWKKERKTGESTWRRILALLLAAVLLVPAVGVSLPAQKAEAAQEKVSMDENAYRALGFDVSEETPEEGYFGRGKTVLNAQKELYFDFNGSSNYGYLIRDTMRFDSVYIADNDLEPAGAYKRYGQYRNGNWAKLDSKNGYNNGRLGVTESDHIGQSLTSDNSHQPIAYRTSTEYKSASGKEDRVAAITVYAAENRCDYRVRLGIFRFRANTDEDGNVTYEPWENSCVYLETPAAIDEAGSAYNEQYDALFEVTAGDYDGDGLDEVAVYFGTNEVRIYKTKYDSLTLWQTITEEKLQTKTGSVMHETDSEGNKGKERAAVVTLASGDLQKDFTEDLAIGVSMPEYGLTAEKNNAYIYGYDKKTGKLKQDEKIELANIETDDTKSRKTMMATSVAIGDLTGNGRQELVVGGRVYEYKGGGNWNGWYPTRTMAAIHVEYNFSSRCYDVAAPQIFEGDHFSSTFLDNYKYGQGGYPTPIGLAICNFGKVGSPEPRLFLYSQLYEYTVGTFKRTDQGMRITTGQKNNDNKDCKKDEVWISHIKVGNFTGNDTGAQQLVAIVGVKESGADKYWYYLSYMGKTQDGKEWKSGWEGIINQATSYLNRGDTVRASAWVSLSTPDLDDDATVLEYLGAESYYTKPEVQAVMQSVPYFQDVADINDNYLNNGATAYGTSKGSGHAVTASIEASVGVYASGKASFFASAEVESTLSATTSFEHQTSWETSTSVEYAGSVGDDYVVMYTIPYHRYWYAYVDEDGKSQRMSIEEPMTPATVIVPVDTYDAMAQTYKGLEPIRGNLIKSTPGEPSTYKNTFSGKYTSIGSVQLLTNAGGNSGATVTVSEEKTVSDEESFSVGVEAELKVGGGAGFLGNDGIMGAVTSAGSSAGYVYSCMNGVAYTATVDNLPADVTGYGFNWQFGAQERELNGEKVILLGYNLTNVKEAPKPPKDLAITEITSREMTLEWMGTPSAAYYELLLITNNGMELPQESIPSTQADRDGSITYTVSNLLPNTQYSYQVIAVDGSGVRSIPSVTVTGTTLSEGDTAFRITKQPEDKQVYAGGTAVFEVETENTTNKSLNYRWQNYDSESGSWKYMNTGYNRRLTVTATPELDGSKYRCIIYTGGTVLTSNAARLTIGKSSSVTGLTVRDAAQNVLRDQAVVQASGTVVEEVPVGTMEVPYTVTTEIDGVTYTKMTDNSGHILWGMKDETGKSCYYSNQALEGGDSPLIGEGAALSEASAYTFVTYKPLEEEGENLEIDRSYETGSLMEIPTDVTAPVPEDVTIERWNGCYHTGSEYIFAAAVMEGENETTGYYLADGTEVFFYDNWQYVTIDGTRVAMRDLTEVTETKTEDILAQQTKVVEGDKLTFTAVVRDGENYVTDNVPSFQILNTTTGVSSSVAASKSGDEYTAQYVFTEPGVYEVTAVYAGSDRYQFSRSDTITLIVKGANARMSISGGSMTYGDTLDLNPVILDQDGNHTADSDIKYTVKKGDETLTGEQAGISGNLFTPVSVGTYQITAEDTEKNITASSKVTVTKRTLTLTPANLEARVGESRAAKAEKLNATKIFTNSESAGKVSVRGLVSGDTISYELKSDALTASSVGEYPITIDSFTSGAAANYTVVLNRGTYTLTQDRVRVTSQTGSNGELHIYYEALGGGQPVEIQSGTYIPKGVKLTVSAQPFTGFGVEKWLVNGERLDHTNTEFTIDALNEDTDISVSFSYHYSVLRYGSVGIGSISGAYAGTGQSAFASGGRLNQTQSVVLTAQPGENSAVDYWEIMKGTQGWERIKAEDGTSDYTGTVYTVSGVSEDTQVRVHFQTKTERTVTVQFKNRGDGQTVFSAGTSLKVNGESVTAADKKYTFTSFDGDNLTFEITVPDNMLVDHWERIGSDGKETIVANNVKQLQVYDLDGDSQYIVYCSIPNQGRVTWGKELDNTHRNGGTLEAAGTITADAGTDSVLTLPQGADVIFTAAPKDGYRISKWTVNGSEAEQSQITELGNGSQSFTLSVSGDDSVRVYFEKKPTVSYRTGANGSVLLTAESGELASGSYVEFGGSVTWTITADAGYTIDTVSLNNVDITEECSLASGNSDIRYYTLDDVNTNQILAATFKKKPVVTYDEDMAEGIVAAKAGEESIASGSFVAYGSTVEWTVTPQDAYVVDTVTVNGKDVTAQCIPDGTDSDALTYSSKEVKADQRLTVTFKAKPTVTYEAEAPEGTVTAKTGGSAVLSGGHVAYGSTVDWTITPMEGYAVEAAELNGEDITDRLIHDGTENNVMTYSAENVQEDMTLVVRYAACVRVTAAAGTNGAVSICYQVSENGQPVEVVSGAYVPKGAKLTVTAQPAEGFTVEAWTVDGRVLGSKALEYTVEALAADTDVQVSFAYKYSMLTYKADGNGTVSGTYEGEGHSAFASGGKLNEWQSVVLTALPDEGSVVDYWEIRQGTQEWTRLKAEDGTSDYTGTSYTVSHMKEDVEVKVHFKAKTARTVTLQFKDFETGQTAFSAGTSLKINGEPVTAADKSYTYESFDGDNLTLDITVPDNMLVDHWTLADSEGTEVTVAGNVNQMKIYDLDGDRRYVVYCSIPNEGQITWGKALDNTHENGGTVEEAGTITADAGRDSVLTLPQGADVVFTAAPAEGYRISKWTVNDSVVSESQITENKDGTQIYTISVRGDDSVLVHFEKKPIASYEMEQNDGTVSMTDGQKEISNGSFVEFGSSVTWTITPEDGYEIDAVTLNGKDIMEDCVPDGEDKDILSCHVEGMQTHQELAVSFKKKPVITWEAEASEGTVTAKVGESAITSGGYVEFGSVVDWTITPAEGYAVSAVTLNGEDITAQFRHDGTTNNIMTYASGNVQEDMTLAVSFAPCVQVTAAAGVNGAVRIHYQVSANDRPVEAESGSRIPKGAKLTVTAEPAEGFTVESWTVDGAALDSKEVEYTVDALTADTDIQVSFAYRYSMLSYEANGNGTLSGAYEGGGHAAFTSGKKLNQWQSVVLTAVPGEKSVVDYWESKTGTGDWTRIRAEDGTSDYTGTTYTVSGLKEDLQIRVQFKEKIERTVTLQFKEFGGNQTAFCEGTSLKVNGEAAVAAGRVYTCQSFEGDNLVLDITVPDNMLVDHWTLANSEGAEITVASNVMQMKIYNLDGDRRYVVYCSIPNEGRITWGKELDNTHQNGGTIEEAGTITADAGTDSVLTMPQGLDVIFTARPAEGYRISKWTVNGNALAEEQLTDAGTGSQSYTMAVGEDDSVLVYFEKKPTVSYQMEQNHGTAGMTDGQKDITSGSFIEFGSSVTWRITPKEEYAVETAVLNGVDITGDCTRDSEDGNILSYTLEHIQTHQELAVTFKKKPVVTYSAETSEGAVTAKTGGTGITSGDHVEFGSTVEWTISPKKEYVVDTVKMIDRAANTETDITEQLILDENNPDIRRYTSENVNTDIELAATFRMLEKAYTVTYSVIDLDADGQGDNGQIRAEASRAGLEIYREEKEAALAGTIQVYEDGEAVLTPVPESVDYRIKECLVNGQKYGVQADGTLRLTAAQLQEAGGQVTVTVQFGVGAPVITFMDPAFREEKAGTLTAEAAGAAIVSGAEVEGAMTFTAVPDANYEVKAWMVNGSTVEGETGNVFVYENAARIDSEVAVILQGIELEVTAASKDVSTGTVAGLPESVRYRDEITLKAEPKTGYVFDGWYVGSEKVSADEEYTFVAENSASYVAEFAEKEEKSKYTITLTDCGHGTITAKAGGSDVTEVEEGTEVTFCAVPEANWSFAGWTVNGQPEDGAETFTWIAGKDFTEDITVGAAFARAVYYEVSYGVENGGGTVTGSTESGNISSDTQVEIVGGSTLTFTAEPEDGNMVACWIINGRAVVGNLSKKLVIENLSEKAEVKVVFEEYAGYRLPESTDDFKITDLTRTPADTVPDTEIRAGGTVTFTLMPVEGTQFTGLEVYGVDCMKAPFGEPQTVLEGDRESVVTVVKNENGSYAVTVEKVWKDILTECETAIVLDKAEVAAAGNQNFVYNGREQIPEKITVTLDGKVLTEDDYDVVYSNNRDAGTAKITVTGKGAYIGTASGSYVIQPRPLTITADNANKVCGYEDPKLTYRADGLVSGDAADVTVKRAAGEKPGTYAITVQAKEHPNYKITCVGGTFTVNGTDPALINRLNAGLGSSWKGKKITVKWGKISAAEGYDIFAVKCGRNNTPKLAATAKKGRRQAKLTRISGKKIKTTAEYKFIVKPFRMVNGEKVYIAESFMIHRAGKDNKRLTNARKIQVKKKSFRLKTGKTAKIKVKLIKENAKKRLLIHDAVAGKGVRYWSSDTKVATVTVKGKIKAVAKGTCTIYVMADDGVKAKIKVKVR